ncbi:S8 family peptidase [Azohydromonas sediminis]|uniref:S8 family peptidase n=1 Tax=Azohydromonas sediminis TaxID=2259674 RepID=UPI0013C332BC|nr:S8 family peptidase [Azohydromonas sediminis]
MWAAVLAGTLAAMTATAAERGPSRPLSASGVQPAPVARVIVRFRDDVVLERERTARAGTVAPLRMARALGERHGFALADGPSPAPRTQVVLARDMPADVLAARLRADPLVAWAEVDERQRIAQTTVAPDDPLYADGQPAPMPAVGQWYLRAPRGDARAAIDAPAAWALTQGADGIVVAVIDTGVRFDHPDLVGKLLPGYDFVSDVATANDGDGWDDDASDPGDWVTAAENSDRNGDFYDCYRDPRNPTVPGPAIFTPSSWHGTQVSGLIGAATNNALGMAGTGWNLKVLPVRALGKCGGYVSDIAAAIRWAAGLPVDGVPPNPNPARVINLSLGSANRCSDTYQRAIDEVRAIGAVVVAAAGNEGVAVNQPANCRGVIAVAGVRHVGTKVGYSNLGPEVALAAPAGNCVNLSGECLYPLLTTSNDGTTVPGDPTYTSAGADATFGTSFASPLVAATAGLMLSVQPQLRPSTVGDRLRASVRPFPFDPTLPTCTVPSGFDDVPQPECNCTTTTCGAGLLDAGAAVALALEPQVSSGGGGAAHPGWLLGLVAATWLLRRQGRRAAVADPAAD